MGRPAAICVAVARRATAGVILSQVRGRNEGSRRHHFLGEGSEMIIWYHVSSKGAREVSAMMDARVRPTNERMNGRAVMSAMIIERATAQEKKSQKPRKRDQYPAR